MLRSIGASPRVPFEKTFSADSTSTAGGRSLRLPSVGLCLALGSSAFMTVPI